MENRAKQQQLTSQPHIARLCALASLQPDEIAALHPDMLVRRAFSARRDISEEGIPVRQPSIVLSGWAARFRQFPNGRRQILHLLLPGDVIDFHQHGNAVAPSAITALTGVTLAAAPQPESAASGLTQAYMIGAALEQAYLLRQVARLGRLDAYERLADLLLELSDRLSSAGLVQGDSFPMPLTQEMLADALGLTSVHVNRTVQHMRRDGMLEVRGNMVRIIDAGRLRSRVDFQPVRVSRQPD